MRTITMLLLPVLFWGFCSVSVCPAQEVVSRDGDFAVVSSGGGGSDDNTEAILIGVAAVIVTVLVILGIRSDRIWNSGVDDGVEYAEADEPTVELTAAGFCARF